MAEIKVAILNTSKEIITVLKEAFEMEGFQTCTGYTYFFKGEEKEFDKFVRKNNPDVIIFDIAIPYLENYTLFKALSERSVVKNIGFLLTTTNKDALEEIVGKTNAHEIIGKPYDLAELIATVEITYKKLKSESKSIITQ